MKAFIKKILDRLGYSIQKKIHSDPFYFLKTLLKDVDNPVIFDVGAHHGETSLVFIKYFPTAKIYAFEPNKTAFNHLNENVKPYENIKIFETALGNQTGKVKFHFNSYSPTNSILSALDSASEIWADGLFDTKKIEEVPIITLDDFMTQQKISHIHLLKMDTQGTEHLTLEGAKNNLKNIPLIYTELSILPSYDGQLAFEDMLKLMREKNFSLFNFYNYSKKPAGQLRQVDAIFVNNLFKL